MDRCADDIYALITGFIVYHVILFTIQKKKDLEKIFLVIILCAPLLTLQGGLQFLKALSLNPPISVLGPAAGGLTLTPMHLS
ncbi:MAG: hypothetical protein PHY90_01240 [Desulfitobacteriaceae bacterium]|nr:hypothetical protein [Desulfitobacteriaceae bacterium]